MRLLFLFGLWALGCSGISNAQPFADVTYAQALIAGCTPSTNIMAITLLDSTSTTANVNGYVSGSFTPAANATLFAVLAGSPQGAYTVTNSGATQFTWWLVGQTNYNTLASPVATLAIFATQLPQGTEPFEMTVGANKTSGTGLNMHIIQVTGADQTAAFGTNAVVQVSFSGGATANPTNSPMTAPGNGGFNSILFAVADDVNSTSDNAGALTWTELAETAYNTPAHGLATYFSNAVPATLTRVTNTAAARDWATMAIEIKAGAVVCEDEGGGLAAFSDDFNRANESPVASPWTEADPDVDLVSNALSVPMQFDFNQCVAIYSGTATTTADQYVKVDATFASTARPSIYFRYISSGSAFYELAFDHGSEVLRWYHWSAIGGTQTTIQTVNFVTVSSPQTVAFTCVGTGDDTVIRLWLDATGLPSAADNWNGDTSPDFSLTTNPGANAVDTGSYVGIGGFNSGGTLGLDNLFGGDVP